jgi:hypothetical protein
MKYYFIHFFERFVLELLFPLFLELLELFPPLPLLEWDLPEDFSPPSLATTVDVAIGEMTWGWLGETAPITVGPPAEITWGPPAEITCGPPAEITLGLPPMVWGPAPITWGPPPTLGLPPMVWTPPP